MISTILWVLLGVYILMGFFVGRAFIMDPGAEADSRIHLLWIIPLSPLMLLGTYFFARDEFDEVFRPEVFFMKPRPEGWVRTPPPPRIDKVALLFGVKRYK